MVMDIMVDCLGYGDFLWIVEDKVEWSYKVVKKGHYNSTHSINSHYDVLWFTIIHIHHTCALC